MEQGDGSKIPVVKIKQLKREPALEYMYKTGKREEELGTGLCADAEWKHRGTAHTTRVLQWMKGSLVKTERENLEESFPLHEAAAWMHKTVLYMDNIFAKSLWITDDHYDHVAQC